MAKTVLAPLLSVVFNKCMVKGVYPNSLKVSQVIPIHKKGDKSACTNYRNVTYHENKKKSTIDINITQMMVGKAVGEEMRHVQMSR